MTNQKPKSNITNTSRACIFIDSSDPSMPYQVIDSKIRPLINLPFPPVIDPSDLVVQQASGGNIPSRAPNAFIIYRKAYIDAAHVDGYHLPMRIMSSMASQSWEQESDTVKSEYRRLANEAFNLRNEMYPKTGCRRKRAKWNIVSFKNKNKITKKRQKWNIVSFDSVKSNPSPDESKQSVEIQLDFKKIPSPTRSIAPSPISQDELNYDEEVFPNFNNNVFPSTEMNFDGSNKLSNEINSNHHQDFIQLSITSNFSPQSNDSVEFDSDLGYYEQPLDGMINQDDEKFSFQHTENDFFNYHQSSGIDHHPNFLYNVENLLNENISSQDYFNGSINLQSADVEIDKLHLYDNENYFSGGLGISQGVEYFQY